MIQSPRKESKAKHARRHRVLQAGRELFLLQGFAATTVDAICEHAGVTKGTFFYHFESKELMAEQLLERFIEQLIAPMAFARDPKTTADPVRRLNQMLGSFTRTYSRGPVLGCLIGVFVNELGCVNERFRRRCQRALETMRNAFRRELAAAQFYRGGASEEFDAEAQAEVILASLQGAVVLARARQDAAILETVAGDWGHYFLRTFGAERSDRNEVTEQNTI